jgi:PIN domain nuclease of toxin-antitoxin system
VNLASRETDRAMDGITVLPLEIVPFDVDLAVESPRLRRSPCTRASVRDRAGLALGRALERRVLTAGAASRSGSFRTWTSR